jgi:N-formylglutamate amidohydrolase
VAVNTPFKGGYITDHYGRLAGVEAIQIEMAQRVYMEEGNPESATEQPRFAAARAMLRRVLGGLAARLRDAAPATG